MSNKKRRHPLDVSYLDSMHDPRPWLDTATMEYSADKPAIVLDRITGPAEELPYCTHGRVTCMWCREWCWLGHATHDVVRAGEANPICKDCAERFIPEGVKRLGRVEDHLRKDGPHE